jgi:GNAT superfamily N-acetyltransferase
VEIRRATVADAAAIAEVHVRTWQGAYTRIFGAERLAGMDVVARVHRWRQWLGEGQDVIVAVDEGRVIGFVWVGPSRDPYADAELYAIYVLPDSWGSGAGAALMGAGVEAMREAGYREAILWVLEDNPRARRFYEREGWQFDESSKEDDALGVRVAEVRYRLRLRRRSR